MYNSLMNRIANFLPLYPVLISIGIMCSLLFTYGWYVNITFAEPKISEAIWGIHPDEGPAAHSQEKPSQPAEKKGDLAMLFKYLFAVDLSTVTTLLLAVSSICITSGFVRIYLFRRKNPSGDSLSRDRGLREKYDALSSSFFPFWPAYKHNFIYLGLLGTLFAFIIAFSQAQKEVVKLNSFHSDDTIINGAPQEDNLGPADILLFALGTALWSSFSAITLSMIPVNPLFRHFFIQRIIPGRDMDKENDEDIDVVLDRLTEKVRQTEQSFHALAETSGSLTKNMDHFNIASLFSRLELLREEFNGLKGNLVSRSSFEDGIEGINADLQRSLSAVKEDMEHIKNTLAGLTGRLDGLETQSAEKTRADAENIRGLRNDITDIVSRLKNLFNSP